MKLHWSDPRIYTGREENAQQCARALASQLPPGGRSRLRLSRLCAHGLRRLLEEADAHCRAGFEGEAVCRLHSDRRRIEACMRAAGFRKGPRLPGQPAPRVLALARCLLAGGERNLDRNALLEGIAAFDSLRPLHIRELEAVPDALRIALCEGFCDAAREILHAVRACRRAEGWVEKGGRLPRKAGNTFLAHAGRICIEEENTQLLKRLAEDYRLELAAEAAGAAEARCCMRLENLMQAYLMLEKLDWRKCFEALSAVEAELREDEIYAAMDAASCAQVRSAVAELAGALQTEEGAVARAALKLAREHETTACFYLIDDAGREILRHALGMRGRLRRRIPDPGGNKTAALMSALALLLLALCCRMTGAPLLWINAVPLAWGFAMQFLGKVQPLLVKPKPLLKLRLGQIPDEARTLVVLPVLLSSPARAEEMVLHMETLGCLEKDRNVDFLLLGDYRDADGQSMGDDEAILAAVRSGVARLNREGGREKYFYLHRGRSYRERDGRWMGEGRKRGALTALNRLLLRREGAEGAFDAEGAAAERIAGRYRYVLTLDADTQYLPGTVQKLAGALLHPLNRRYALLQSCVEAAMESNVNAYTDLVFGAGGVDSYPVSVSDFYQDMTGWGNFSGKGIYDVRAFAAAVDGALPDEEILSHDLIEGILAGTGFVSDLCFYDGVPENLESELSRRHRWIRGDWQLMRVLFSKLPICALDRMKMAGNLLRSLQAPAALGLLVGAVWMDAPGAFLLGLLAVYMEALLSPLHAKAWRRAALQLATLPAVAARSMDAVFRALWRLFVSRKHLLDWVPAADAAASGTGLKVYGRIAAILLLPGLLRAYWVPAVLALALLFWVGTDWADDLARKRVNVQPPLHPEQLRLLETIATETWHFFETFVPEDGCGLPPDNVQFDPPAGVAFRTSPTNIGLYLMSCLSARELGIISIEEMERRMAQTADTLLHLEKWQGQLYNWYDTRSLKPLKPRYVSAVDSGNLAAALLLCSRAVQGSLALKLRGLAQDMRLDALYDSERELFYIGMNVEDGCMSRSHYDLYASEARILSYTAMMLGQVPLKHWLRLGRPSVSVEGGRALLSWSGTMFEYLMPELLLRSHPLSLAGRSRIHAVRAQLALGRRLNRPWGVSESGHYAFDLQFNYQYHAFGLRCLAMNGETVQDVVAPYAAALALCCMPGAAAENLKEMRSLGWSNAYGMLEAADYRGHAEPRLVKSCMAHHQGMILCAACNALREDALAKKFMELPEARALKLLLQEKCGVRLRLPQRREKHPAPLPQRRTDASFRRMAAPERSCESHLLHGAGVTVLATGRGAAFIRRRSLLLNRFSGDLSSRHEGAFVHIEDVASGERTLFGGSGDAEFDAGNARFAQELGEVRAQLTLAVSPEDGAFFQRVTLENRGASEREFAVAGCMAVALAQEKDMCAHASFQNLFVESARVEGGIAFRRRMRERHAAIPQMFYLCSEAAEAETDMEKLTGRCGSLGLPGGIADVFSETIGAVLNPCAALRCRVRVPAGGSVKLHFVLALAGDTGGKLDCLRQSAAAERAIRLAEAHARAALRHIGMDGSLYRLANRAAALLADAYLRPQLYENREAAPMGREALWQAGISGDLPILLCRMDDMEESGKLRCLLRLHAYYRMMGIETDLVLVDGGETDYRRPTREAVEACISASHLHALRGIPGGVFLLDAASAGMEALQRYAALCFRGAEGIPLQLRRMLEKLNLRESVGWTPMQAQPMEILPKLDFFNGYGGFAGEDYLIILKNGLLPPAPWSNILSAETAGAVMTERGGGFIWQGNSRSGRITPFTNDLLREGWGWIFYLLDSENRRWMRLLPGDKALTDFCVRFAPGRCRWEGACAGAAFAVEAVAAKGGVEFAVEVENTGKGAVEWQLAAAVNWLLGTDAADAGMLRSWHRNGMCFAAGPGGVGCFASDELRARPGCDLRTFIGRGDMLSPAGLDELEHSRSGWTLRLPLELKRGERKQLRFMLCCGRDADEARRLAHDFSMGETEERRVLRIETPDRGLNLLANAFLPAQVKYSRVLARTGLYQPGGAYGFRDQLQDMLPLAYTDPERVRAHLLRCAARQFEDGDVLHWWHEPCTGVRTRISDDLLFLPYVTAHYVKVTGDVSVLKENIPFLEAVEIPEGKEDIYAPMRSSQISVSLHTHCMRAFNRAARTGEHGLCLMGGGDWNDGMNRVGVQGRGESVWLTQFLAACAAEYAEIAPDADDRAWLLALNRRMCAAVEARGWDGAWYLRAYADDGSILGGHESACCRIDAISQAWAVLSGLDSARCASAMDAAWKQLVDEQLGLIRLLVPPFDGQGFDPGYIAAYPPGIRENGAQYSHAACWLLLALVRMGDAERAHRALEMLLPISHADTKEKAELYRVEPYVMAADVYTDALHAGRGGWTWYTGSAAWLLMAVYALLGFERRGKRVRLHALLGDWKQASLTLEYGNSSYELVCTRDARELTLDGAAVAGDWLEMTDDGRKHRAVFPARKPGTAE